MSDSDLFVGVLPFFYTAEERSFRRAARRLGVSPAAVSKAVRKLEERLGAQLLARTSRSVTVTPEGVEFQARCREAVASIEAGRDGVMATRRQPRGELHVSVSFVLGRVIIPELTKLSARYPALRHRITMTDRPARLVEEGVDVAVRIGALEDSSLKARRLRGSRWVTVASPGFLARHGPPTKLADLAHLNCLRFLAPDGRARDWTFNDLRDGEAKVHKVSGNLVIDQGEHLLHAAEAGLGLAQALDFMVGPQLADGRLVEVLQAHAADGPVIHALTPPERSRSAAVRAFVGFLADVFSRLDVVR